MRWISILVLTAMVTACPEPELTGDAGVEVDSGQALADTGSEAADTGNGQGGGNDGGQAVVDGGSASSDGGSAPTDGGIEVDAGPVEGVRLSGTVRDFQSQSGVSGVRVCVYEQPQFPCTTSDQDGAYRLTVPSGNLVMIYDEGENPVIPQLMPLVVGDEAFTWNQIVVSQQASGMMFRLWGQENDPSKGSVAVTSFMAPREADGLEGAAAAIAPASGTGPFYTANGFPSAGATATDTNGLAAFLNVDPGEGFSASVTKAGWTCEIPSDREPETFPVVAGHLTSVTRRCTQ